MKEKTFEELITEKRRSSINRTLYDNDIKELMQQVREATIAECREAIRKEHKTYTPFEGRHYQLPLGEQLYNLNKLPTDRINIKK